MQGVPRGILDIISGGYFNSSTSRGGSQEISHDIAEIDDAEGSYSHMTCSRCVRMPNGSQLVGRRIPRVFLFRSILNTSRFFSKIRARVSYQAFGDVSLEREPIMDFHEVEPSLANVPVFFSGRII